MSLPGLLLGFLDIAIVAAFFIFLGLIVIWFISLFGFGAPPRNVQRAYMLLVLLICLYMLVSLFLGYPTVHILRAG